MGSSKDNRLMETTDYSGMFVYKDGHVDYIQISEGRMYWDNQHHLFYAEYFITDHLGNVRDVITTNPNQSNFITQVTDYYPFGLEIKEINASDNLQLYNSKELQDDAKLWWYDYGARFYDPVLARWHSVDPMAEVAAEWSPYRYGFDNPINYFDPSGMLESTHTDEDGNVVAVYDDGDLGVYKHEGKGDEAAKIVEKNYSGDNTSAGGEKMGETVQTYSFADFGKVERGEKGNIAAEGAKIDFGSTWAKNQIDGALSELTSFNDYVSQATGSGKYNLKVQSEKGIYSGSQVKPGVYGSARDAGNILAGAAAAKFGLDRNFALNAFGAFNLGGNNKIRGALIFIALI